MDRGGWQYPSGDIRVSDADRDQALSELRAALSVGRLTADEFDERAGQAVSSRTGNELTALLADLPVERLPAPPPAIPDQSDHLLATRVAVAASALGATVFALAATAAAVSRDGFLQQQDLVRSQLALQGGPDLPPASFNWAIVIAPGAIALAFVVLVVVLSIRLARADRR